MTLIKHIFFRSSSNGHISINDRGSKNILQKYFAEPYFRSCFFSLQFVFGRDFLDQGMYITSKAISSQTFALAWGAQLTSRCNG